MTQNISNNYGTAIKVIKQAILKSRYKAATLANREMLMLYFGVGEYISNNSRKNSWGTNAIEVISEQLQKELPGLRGFSPTNLKNMRLFYEAWSQLMPMYQNRQLITDDFENTDKPLISTEILIRQLPTDEFNGLTEHFLSIGFTHHCEIINKVKQVDERLFYIEQCAEGFWSVEKLKYNLKSNLYAQQGSIISNFGNTISNVDFRGRALRSFKDEYLLDFTPTAF
jgi:predicted nuclease of restriction endonuclease-like (RecB) superfamily